VFSLIAALLLQVVAKLSRKKLLHKLLQELLQELLHSYSIVAASSVMRLISLTVMNGFSPSGCLHIRQIDSMTDCANNSHQSDPSFHEKFD